MATFLGMQKTSPSKARFIITDTLVNLDVEASYGFTEVAPCFGVEVTAERYIKPRLQEGLREMLCLADDWDTYGSIAPTKETVQLAESVIKKFPFAIQPEIYPHKDGSIGLYWDLEDITFCIQLTAKTFPEIIFITETGDEILQKVCFLSDSFLNQFMEELINKHV